MTEEKVVYKNQGIGFGGLLTLLFIGLKLGHVIDWSWWWVFAPIWGSLVIVLVLFMIMVGIVLAFGAK